MNIRQDISIVEPKDIEGKEKATADHEKMTEKSHALTDRTFGAKT